MRESTTKEKLLFVMLIAVMNLASGCASSTGWRFEIGVSPIKSLNNQAGLEQINESPKLKQARY